MFFKLTEHYIRSHLKEVVGLEPNAAAQALRSSVIGHEFRCFRIVEDIVLSEGHKYAREERYHGRVSFKVKDDRVSEVWYESCSGFTSFVVGTEVEQIHDGGLYCQLLDKDAIFVMGPRQPLRGMPVRQEIQSIDRSVAPRGWLIENIAATSAISPSNASDAPKERRRIPPTQSPRFTYL